MAEMTKSSSLDHGNQQPDDMDPKQAGHDNSGLTRRPPPHTSIAVDKDSAGSGIDNSQPRAQPGDSRNGQLDQLSEKQEPGSPVTKKQRLKSLDVHRGLTIAVMILVDDAGSRWSEIDHSPWNGCTLADFVMPFFLFIVGMAIALALKRISGRAQAVRKVVLRTIKMVLWGLILQGGYTHFPFPLDYGVDMNTIRWCGILQRIALAYLVVSIVEIATTKTRKSLDLPEGRFTIFTYYKWHWLCAAVVLIVYLCIVYGLYVPDWQFTSLLDPSSPDYGKVVTVECGVRAKFNPPCNAVGYVDRKIQGIKHLYQSPVWVRSQSCVGDQSPDYGDVNYETAPKWCQAPFEPEGLLSSWAAILSCFLGIHYGHVLIHFKEHRARLIQWFIPSIILVILGLVLHYSGAIALNKQLYSVSYVAVTGGAAGLVFCAFYLLIDVYGVHWPFSWLEWMGMNAMLVFVGGAQGAAAGFINGWYWHTPEHNLTWWIQKHVFNNVWHSEKTGILLYVIFCEEVFWVVVSGLCHWQGWYWKL